MGRNKGDTAKGSSVQVNEISKLKEISIYPNPTNGKCLINLDKNAPGSYRLLINFAKVINNQKLYTETLTEAQKNIPNFVFNE